MRESCIFCEIAAGRAPADIVYEDEEVIAFRDNRPVAPVHILVIPRSHLTSVAEASSTDAALLGKLLLAAAQVAEAEGVKQGFRLVANSGSAAGQSIFHLHLHMLGGRRMS